MSESIVTATGHAVSDESPVDEFERLRAASASPRRGRGPNGSTGAREPRAPRTDLGNAERFAEDHAGDVLSVPGPGWQVWDEDEGRFRRDDDGSTIRLGKRTVRAIRDEASAIEDPELAKKMFKHAVASESRPKLSAMLSLAASEEPLICRVEELDADPMLLTVANGTLDLRTGELRPHRRDDRITKLAPVAWDPDASCPTWDRALDVTFGGDRELIAYVQRAVGYSLTGDTSEQCAFVLVGPGGNGKTTILSTVSGLLGDYAVHAAASSFMTSHHRGVRSDLARLRGARFVPAVEVEEDAQLAEVLVKQVTGGDKVVASHLYQDEFEFLPRFKLWLAANHKPRVRGGDDAIWDRLRLIPTPVRIRGTRHEVKGLGDRLARERPGVLRWAVEGCLAWRREGLGTAERVATATTAYRDEQDHVGRFVEERCLIGPEHRVLSGELWKAYKAWCEDEGHSPLSEQRFWRSAAMERHPTSRSAYERFRSGIGLREGR